MTTRRQFIKKSMGCLLAGSLGSGGVANALSTKPQKIKSAESKTNVLIIIVEDLKIVLGCYGNPIVQTPNLDRLAQKGMRFTHAYCQFPVCNPSRASLLYGLRPDTGGILGNFKTLHSAFPDAVTPRWLSSLAAFNISSASISPLCARRQ